MKNLLSPLAILFFFAQAFAGVLFVICFGANNPFGKGTFIMGGIWLGLIGLWLACAKGSGMID